MKNYHRICAVINLGNIYHNISQIKKSFKEDVHIMPVIKADGYGHGAVQTAQVLEKCADSFAVAVIEEAKELRNAGITKPIMILGTLPTARYEEAVANDVIIPIYTVEMAKLLSNAAKSMNKIARTHIAVDTGMNRIGMKCDKSGIELIKKIMSYEGIEISGIFSHFATADYEDKTFSNVQWKRFNEFLKDLENEGIKIPCKHICNSAAILDMPHMAGNLVRPGIITYGLYPSDEVDKNAIDLRPAMELKSHISFVKEVKAGCGISYGGTNVSDKDRIIATVPVGYADGYPRLLSDKGRVIIRGEYAPIVGRICMDQFMVDVTHIDGVSIEDTVTLMGKDGDCYIGAEEIANHAMTINYEIICGIGKRVPRVYMSK